MEQRLFGATGCHLSVFTLGTMRFLNGWDEPHDVLPEDSLANAHSILQSAIKAGINHIETARGYGKSERLIGRVLPHLDTPRDQLIITTKAPPTETALEMRHQLDDSLKRMGLDRVDLFALHGLNNLERFQLAIRPGGCLAALEQARHEGLIGSIGFSSHAPLPLLLAIMATKAFSFVNLHYNFFRQDNRAAVDLAESMNMGLFIISPNEKGGLLYDPPPHLSKLTHPLHPVHFNERWLLSQPQVHTLSVGLSLPQHVDIHLQSLKPQPYWGANERRIQADLTQALAQSPLQRCGPCRQCLPCPVKIDMPTVLRLKHLQDTLEMGSFARFRYDMMQPDDHWIPGARSNLCTRCNDCLIRCPQQLNIPDLMHQAHQQFSR